MDPRTSPNIVRQRMCRWFRSIKPESNHVIRMQICPTSDSRSHIFTKLLNPSIVVPVGKMPDIKPRSSDSRCHTTHGEP